MQTYLQKYQQTHTNQTNKALHSFGIPMIVVSIISIPVIGIWFEWKYWPISLGLFVVGWILQFIGHFFEGKQPAFFENPIYLVVGIVWWFKKIFGKK